MDISSSPFTKLGDLLQTADAKEKAFWSGLRKTGYQQFDEEIGGLRSGELVVIASPYNFLIPSFCLKIVESVAVDQQLPVLHVRVGNDLRSSVGLWLKRTETDKTWWETKKNKTDHDLSKLSEHIEAPIYVLNAHGYSLKNLTDAIDSCAKNLGQIGLVLIDGLERLDIFTGNPDSSISALWANVSRELKSLAVQHNCPVVVDSYLQGTDESGIKIELPTIKNLPHDAAVTLSADHVFALDVPNGYVSGEAAELYTIYSRNGLRCNWMGLKFEHESGRWTETEKG